jgi:hypothetical protein
MVQPDFFAIEDLRRPQAPALGFTPAQTRAKGLRPLDSRFARAGNDAAAPFPATRKGKWLNQGCQTEFGGLYIGSQV